MTLNLDHKTAQKIAAETLQTEGFNVSLDKKISPDFTVDLFATRGSTTLLLELKPQTKIDDFDLMTLESYAVALKSEKTIEVRKLFLYKDASSGVSALSKKYGIELISAKKGDQLKADLLKIAKK
jgi:hypothetical protein